MKKRRYHKRSPFSLKLKKQTIYTVGAIWLWLFAGVILLSFFGSGSLLRLRTEMYAHFERAMYPIPPFLILLSLLFFKVKSDIARPNIPTGYLIILLSLMGLFQQGSFGEAMFSFVANMSSAEVSILIFLTLFVLGCIVMFNASLDAGVNAVLGLIERVMDAFGNMFSGKKDLKGLEKKQLVIKGEEADGKAKPVLMPPTGGVKPAASMQTSQQEQQKPGLKINNTMSTLDQTSMWEYPQQTLLSDGPKDKADRGDLRGNAHIIEQTLDSFGIKEASVVEVNPGPAVTQYALQIPLGIKVSKITSLSSDLALMLSAPTGQVRIEAPIPGRNLVGIEIPNRGLEFVTLKRMLASDQMKKAKSKLTVALGLDVSGAPVVADIAKMPHVLIAGTTGSGKSVLVNAFISSLLFRTTPQEVKLILVDPKRVELTGYNGIPHLLTPVIVEPDKILSALHWAVHEMEERYKKFAEVRVRNIDGFNELSGFQAMPYIVIFIDELADLMAYAPVDVEDNICRLAQMARAVGIHLVLATQRPSVDVITGLIKANIPTRIAFNVSSMIDSRVIIDMPGAEKLLGRGDMLFIPPDQSKPSRIQGTFVSEAEVGKVVDFLRSHNQPVQYTEEVITTPVSSAGKRGSVATNSDGRDELFADALRLVCQYDKASSSLLQRRLHLGYARAARIIDELEMAGVVGPAEGAKPRDVLVKDPDQWLAAQAAPAQE